MRMILLLIASVALGVFPATNVNAQSTTRIETNPSYGAIVTIENGVKVYRILPGHDRIIINPEGKTPLYLGYDQVTVDERNYNYNYDYGPGYYDAPTYGYGGYWGYGRGGRGKHRGLGHRGGRSGLGGGGHKGGHGGGGGHSGLR